MKSENSRRNFFSMIGKTTLFGFIAAHLPANIFSSINKDTKQNIRVETHHSAIKRNK
ncbi:MAG: hypothetical protein KF816_08215 [Melioribacteraceae bacterium]|nr:hypothetical protein [Melioribacteraceae bacterium]